MSATKHRWGLGFVRGKFHERPGAKRHFGTTSKKRTNSANKKPLWQEEIGEADDEKRCGRGIIVYIYIFII